MFFSKFIYDSSNIRFSDNLLGCHDCIRCHGLENQSFCIDNKKLSKEEFNDKKKEILSQKRKYEKWFADLSVSGLVRNSENVVGHTLYNCHDVENGYEVSNFSRARNILYCDGGNDSSDCYDVIDAAADRTHHLYGVMGQAFGDHVYLSINVVESSYIYYSSMLLNCNYCLGCFNLTGKSYCIFNKQYTKEERYDKVDKIFTQMEKDGTLGNFSPGSMNPFYFNDTAAYLIDDSFTKEEVEAKGYLRRDEPITVDIPEGVQTVRVSELGEYEGWGVDGEFVSVASNDSSTSSEGQWYINPEIMKKVIVDEEGNAYRVIPMEYEFLVKHGLPLPRKHWLERIKQHFSLSK